MKNIFGARLKDLRQGMGVTQVKLAEVLDVKQSAICNWETYDRQGNLKNIVKVADYFGVSVDYLIGRTNNPDMNI